MIRDNSYVLNNCFSHREKEVRDYIQLVFTHSILYYQDNIYNRFMMREDLDNDIKCIQYALSYLEDYLFYYDNFYPDEFDSIFDCLKSKLDKICVLPSNKRGIYGEFEEDKKLVSINPNLGSSTTLSDEERTRLYMCHELGHIINSEWMNSADSYINKADEPLDIKQLMYDGLSLIDEATTQNRAEAITYHFSEKRRFPMSNHRKAGLFGGEAYLSNFDFYGELQEPAIIFGKTLRGIGKVSNDQDALHLLSAITLDKRFVEKLFYEYENDGHLNDLYFILTYMGVIKNASYAMFGYGDRSYIEMSKQAKDELIRIAEPLRDYRDPYHY